jgi:hypothetical protein
MVLVPILIVLIILAVLVRQSWFTWVFLAAIGYFVYRAVQ